MRLTSLFTRTSKDTSQSDVSRNAQLLGRAGFVDKLMAGVYSYLPLGLRTLNHIENIIREEMNSIGAQEVLMPALQPREIWDQTGRWEKVDVLYKFKGQGDRDLTLGATHEEVVTPLVTQFIRSYRDLPASVYQIQTKFRNEARAKSGLLRGREFRMKDMYSFHSNSLDLDQYYERVISAYKKIFSRCGLGDITLLTYASGGIFSKFSHEFQTITPYGEDTVYRVPGTDTAVNKEIIGDEGAMREVIPDYSPNSPLELQEEKAIEVGNIFKLGTRFPDAFDRTFVDQDGKIQKLHMGCYGIGPSRLLGTIAECLSDDKGLAWPTEVAPYQAHLVSLVRSDEESQVCEKIYHSLMSRGVEVIFDDRRHIQAGEKLADCDLLGMPQRIVVSSKTLAKDTVELKMRTSSDAIQLSLERLLDEIGKPPK